jgi:hypothetical protein
MSEAGPPNQPTIDRIRDLLTRSWERAGGLAAGSLADADDALNRAVDKAVAARFEVPDLEAFHRALEAQPSVDDSVVSSKTLVAIVIGIAARFSALKRLSVFASRWSAWITGAVVVGSRARVAVGRGLREVQVLASYLGGRAAREDAELDDRLLRTLTVAVYLDPTKTVDFRYRGKRAGAALAGQWTANALRSGPAPATRVRSWVGAIDALDLAELQAEWDRSGD